MKLQESSQLYSLSICQPQLHHYNQLMYLCMPIYQHTYIYAYCKCTNHALSGQLYDVHVFNQIQLYRKLMHLAIASYQLQLNIQQCQYSSYSYLRLQLGLQLANCYISCQEFHKHIAIHSQLWVNMNEEKQPLFPAYPYVLDLDCCSYSQLANSYKLASQLVNSSIDGN